MARRQLLLMATSLLTAAVGLPAQDADLRSKINDALDMARPALLGHLKTAVKGSPRAGELSLLVLAALHDGVSVADPDLAAAIKKLAKAKPHQTYDIALRLIVLEACPTFPDRMAIAKKDTQSLLGHRCDEGAFQYEAHPSTWDLSNTQYGALGLRAAWAMGIKVPKATWSKLAREIGEQQSSYGGFGYQRSRNRNGAGAYASMTVAGIAVLAVCRQALGENYVRRKELDQQINRGWLWLAQNSKVIGSVKERWSYYFHYGLERAAILCDVDKVGGVTDWYVQGAKMLIEEQLVGGGWSSHTDGFPGTHLSNKRGDSVPTSFAILFLRRKFQKEVGPITENIVRLVNIGPFSKQKDVDECAKQLAKRGKEAIPEILQALRSDTQPQRVAAAKAFKEIAGEDYGYDAKADGDANRGAIHKAELWWLKNR
jgi:hypothetical protein